MKKRNGYLSQPPQIAGHNARRSDHDDPLLPARHRTAAWKGRAGHRYRGSGLLRRMYLHLVHRAAEKFLPKQADSVADSGQSADLRTGKRDIHHDRVAAHCGFQRIPNLRAEIHPDRTPRSRPGDRRGKKPDCQRAYALANEILWIPPTQSRLQQSISARRNSKKILREYLQASREKSAAN